MRQVNIHAAKTHLSSLVDKAAAGEPFVIAKAGRPLVTVNPLSAAESCPRTGFMKGKISVPEDFDRMGANEINRMFGVES
jgi:prevent-host-death family protein